MSTAPAHRSWRSSANPICAARLRRACTCKSCVKSLSTSVFPRGEQKLGVKSEIKNMNSFRSVERALAYEAQRQIDLLRAGQTISQETRGWGETRGITVPQRSKEQAHAYRYFPEPALPPLVIDPAWVEELRARLPELPDARRARYMRDYGLSAQDANVLTEDKALGDSFE